MNLKLHKLGETSLISQRASKFPRVTVRLPEEHHRVVRVTTGPYLFQSEFTTQCDLLLPA